MNKNQNEDKEITKLKAQHCYAPKVSGDSDQPRTSTGGSRGLGKFLLVPSQTALPHIRTKHRYGP